MLGREGNLQGIYQQHGHPEAEAAEGIVGR